MYIVADGQFLKSWDWDPQALGSGSYRLGQDELDRREFARVGNLLAGPQWVRPRAKEADWGQTRLPRIRQGRESAKRQCWGQGGLVPSSDGTDRHEIARVGIR